MARLMNGAFNEPTTGPFHRIGRQSLGQLTSIGQVV